VPLSRNLRTLNSWNPLGPSGTLWAPLGPSGPVTGLLFYTDYCATWPPPFFVHSSVCLKQN